MRLGIACQCQSRFIIYFVINEFDGHTVYFMHFGVFLLLFLLVVVGWDLSFFFFSLFFFWGGGGGGKKEVVCLFSQRN